MFVWVITGVFVAVCAFLAFTYVMPWINWLLSFIWEDPTRKLRPEVAQRVKELCVDGDVSEETAVLMAAKEFNADEDALRESLEGVSFSSLKAAASGSKMGMLNLMLGGALRRTRFGAGPRGKR